jgi:imidazoleglycerol-phosphate dehydratase
MDDALAYAAVDLAKRPYVYVDLGIEGERVEDVAREDIEHFVRSLAMGLEANIHIKTLYGRDDHHKIEAAVKALALSLRQAMEVDERRKDTPSSKGVM